MSGTIAAITVTGLGSQSVLADDYDDVDLNENEEEKAKDLLSKLRESANPEEKFEKLEEDEKDLVLESLKPTDVSVDLPDNIVGILDSGKEVTADYTGTNPISGDLWTFTAILEWSYDGTEVTSVDRTVSLGETHEIGWSYDGTEVEDVSGGEGENSVTYLTEGDFNLCFQGCIQSASPVIEIDGYADGDWDADSRE
ncbi:hypothetical protein [Halostagnicola bangensis]